MQYGEKMEWGIIGQDAKRGMKKMNPAKAKFDLVKQNKRINPEQSRRRKSWLYEDPDEQIDAWCKIHISAWNRIYVRCLAANQLKKQGVTEIGKCEEGD